MSKITGTVLLAGVLGLAQAAWAQGADDDASIPDPFDGAIHEGALSLEDCRRLLGRAPVAHTPDASVDYRPGEDVRGNPVTPAEGDQPILGARQIEVPKRIKIDFGYDLAGAYGIPDTGLETATANVLLIEYDVALGGLTVNGKPLNTSDTRAARRVCEMRLEQAESDATAE